MDDAILVDHGVGIRCESALERDVGIELAVLIEIDDAETVRGPDLSLCRLNVPRIKRSSVVLPLPFGPTSPTRMPGLIMRSRPEKSVLPAIA